MLFGFVVCSSVQYEATTTKISAWQKIKNIQFDPKFPAVRKTTKRREGQKKLEQRIPTDAQEMEFCQHVWGWFEVSLPVKDNGVDIFVKAYFRFVFRRPQF